MPNDSEHVRAHRNATAWKRRGQFQQKRYDMDDFSFSINLKCGLCHAEGGSGRWQLCSDCRAELKHKAATFAATAMPSVCLGCSRPRPPHSTSRGVYCPECSERFGAE